MAVKHHLYLQLSLFNANAMTAIPNFPFLSPGIFSSICKSFLTRVQAVGGADRLGWLYAVIENEDVSRDSCFLCVL